MPHSRISIPPRVGAQLIEARGIFPGAEVTRGCDWMQDGNETTCSLTDNFYNTVATNLSYGGFTEFLYLCCKFLYMFCNFSIC